MECPQCRTEIPDEEWNCPSCRINVYWAHQHFDELSALRSGGGMSPTPATPAFLVASSKRAFDERAERNSHIDSSHIDGRARDIARRAMRENESMRQ